MPRSQKWASERAAAERYIAAYIAWMATDVDDPAFADVVRAYEHAAENLATHAVRVLVGEKRNREYLAEAHAALEASDARVRARSVAREAAEHVARDASSVPTEG